MHLNMGPNFGYVPYFVLVLLPKVVMEIACWTCWWQLKSSWWCYIPFFSLLSSSCSCFLYVNNVQD